jgi:hypothetical protein
MTGTALNLTRDAAGQLVHVDADGGRSVGVMPVRAFPLSEPGTGISLVDTRGREVVWIESLADVTVPARALIEDELSQREFRPIVQRIVGVSTFATPSTWSVETDHGDTSFVLKAEEDIRRLQGARLLITSSDGVCYEIADRWALDRASRRLLERFL